MLARARRLYATAKYPELLPPVLPRVHFGEGPAHDGRFDYYDPESNVIYWTGGDAGDPGVAFAFLHECGHAFDRQVFRPLDRKQIEALLDILHRRWFWGSWDPETHSGIGPVEEVFADAYARALLYRLRPQSIRLRRLLRKILSQEG